MDTQRLHPSAANLLHLPLPLVFLLLAELSQVICVQVPRDAVVPRASIASLPAHVSSASSPATR